MSVKHRPLAATLALCAALAAQAAAPCFTVKLKVDLSGVTAGEALYEVGCARLALRIAGQDKKLVSYDNRQGTMICRRAGKFKKAEQTRGLLREGGRFATIWTTRMKEPKEIDLAKADVKGIN